MQKPLKERIKFLMQQKQCYRCLQPMSDGHNAKTCTSKLICSSCKWNHPTLLHGYVSKDKRSTDGGNQDPEKTEEALKNSFAGLDDLKCAATSKKHGSNVISMCVVPVKVKHEHGANEVTTYAMLDNCSQGSFIHDSVPWPISSMTCQETWRHWKQGNYKSEDTTWCKIIKSSISRGY